MKDIKVIGIFLLIALFYSTASYSAEPTREEATKILQSLHWMRGPQTVDVGSNAKFKIPEHYVFLNAEDTRKFMALNENPDSGHDNLFAPDDLHWFAIFRYVETGHIMDDQKIDADSVLQAVQSRTEESNKVREQHGWPDMHVVGWKYRPFYDSNTHRLDWAIIGESNGRRTINYNTRILSRTGVTSVTLVSDINDLDASVNEFKSAVIGYSFDPGQRYSEFRQGDSVAKYGLAALIAGGAAAVATKKGLLAVIGGALAAAWKFIAAAFMGLLAWLRSFFKRKS
jgi:uncharacterized membrane-anchored protein